MRKLTASPPPDPSAALPGHYVYWSGRVPVYGIRADTPAAAAAYARSQHPAGTRFEVRPDDGTLAAWKIDVILDGRCRRVAPRPVKRRQPAAGQLSLFE
jgi:hypothetical protein